MISFIKRVTTRGRGTCEKSLHFARRVRGPDRAETIKTQAKRIRG